VSEVPALSGANELPAAVRPRTDDAALCDDRLPCPPQPPMLRVVVEEPFLWPASRELMREAAEPLMRGTRHEHTTAEVALPWRKDDA
jgi:hypothetical protein